MKDEDWQLNDLNGVWMDKIEWIITRFIGILHKYENSNWMSYSEKGNGNGKQIN